MDCVKHEKKNVLVIGGTRFSGIPMVEKLLERGHSVKVATRGVTQDTFGNKIERIKLNIYEPESVKHAIAGRYFDVIIDKMGYGSSDVNSILSCTSCDHFIHMSTAGVYQMDHIEIKEDEFQPERAELIWCTRGDYTYDYVKQMAEAAIVQKYPSQKFSIVRSPFVLGRQDYTERLKFYVQHIINGTPMYIDNLEEKFCVANATELGYFIADLVDVGPVGCINFCSKGLVSVRSIVNRIELLSHSKAVIDDSGDPAPYNGTKMNKLSLQKAEKLGFRMSHVDTWIDDLIEYYINNDRG